MRCFLLFLSLSCLPLSAQRYFSEVDVDWVLNAYPARVQKLLDHVDWDKVAGARVQGEDPKIAVDRLLAHYRNATTFPHFRQPDTKHFKTGGADVILRDTFRFQGVTGHHRRRADGALDWEYAGPRDDVQWTYFLARHQVFKYLMNASLVSPSGNKYGRHFNGLMVDWVVSNPPQPQDEATGQWLAINTGIRSHLWPELFYGMQRAETFTDGARLLMLISVIEQAESLLRFHWAHHNHALHELLGLAAIAVYWPELTTSDEWFDYAAKHMLYELEAQVLPDGAQDELTSLYHRVAMTYFADLVEIAHDGGRELPPVFTTTVEKMYGYLAGIVRPDGKGIPNNDSDVLDFTADLRKGAAQFDRPDWTYIATNGREGTPPTHTSVLFPYAGHAIFRNNWSATAHWLYFDAGPYGSSHQNNDKLHLSAFYKRHLLVDGGRYHYNTSVWRKFLFSSFAHNTILVDGFGQNVDEKHYRTANRVIWREEEAGNLVYAQGEFTAGYQETEERMVHTRGVAYLKDKYWVVADRVTGAGEHRLQPLWHFHPDCAVKQQGNVIYTDDPATGNLMIVPLGKDLDWVAETRFGPAEVDESNFDFGAKTAFDDYPVQSWYSERYNQIEPGTVGVYSATMRDAATFGWLLLPFDGETPPAVQATGQVAADGRLTVSITLNGETDQLILDLTTGTVAR